MTTAHDLSTKATEFQSFLNSLMPFGAVIGVVDDSFRPLGAGGVVKAIPRLVVCAARQMESGEVFYDVLVSQYHPDDASPEVGLLVAITDPFEQLRPDLHVVVLRDPSGVPWVPGRWLMLCTTLTPGQFDQIEAAL